MEEYTQITLDQWAQWKEDIRQKLAETANNFVYIGYRLKQIRDSGMYDGAADIFEFAQKEYGMGKSTVSRFIAINEKYSEGGNSLELRKEFRSFSSSKLSEMLTLPDNEIQLINERTTVRAIRELKQFNAEDPEKVLEEETAKEELSATGEQEKRTYTPLEKCLIDFFRTKQRTLAEVMELLDQETTAGQKQAAELMAPSGQAFHKKGIVFLFLYEWGEGVKYKLMTEPEPVFMTWTDFLEHVRGIFKGYGIKEFYEKLDGTHAQSNQGFPAVATSQRNAEQNEEKSEQKTENCDQKVEKREQTKEREEDTEETDEKSEEKPTKATPEAGDVEAAGIEEEENGEVETKGEAGADAAEDEETSADPEPGDNETDAVGGTGEGGSCGGKAGEEQSEEQLIKDIRKELQTLAEKIDDRDWWGTIDKARDVIYIADTLKGIEFRRNGGADNE